MNAGLIWNMWEGETELKMC